MQQQQRILQEQRNRQQHQAQELSVSLQGLSTRSQEEAGRMSNPLHSVHQARGPGGITPSPSPSSASGGNINTTHSVGSSMNNNNSSNINIINIAPTPYQEEEEEIAFPAVASMSPPSSLSTPGAGSFPASYTALPPNIQARIQRFQQSRPSRSNSGSNGGLSPQAISPSSPIQQPSQTSTLSSNLSSVLKGASPSNLSRSSSITGSSGTGTSCLNSPVTEDPLNALETELARKQEQIKGSPAGSLSGPLFVNPKSGASLLQSKKPSLSERRKVPKLNTADITSSSAESTPSTVTQSNRPSLPKLPIDDINNASDDTKNFINNNKNNDRPRVPKPMTSGGAANLFKNYEKYIDVHNGKLNFAGKASLHSKGIDFSSGSSFRISMEEFENLGELGRGNYGTVTKVLHRPTNVVMAMKEIRLELDEVKFAQIIMELDILHKCNSPYIVDFYGAFFVEGAVYVCMEYMDGGSLDKIYEGGIDEPFLAYITEAVVRGLKELKDVHNIIHRDVKPTNILVSTSGKVKLCDFGVSGNLVASIARTNIGCQSYMAPERIRSTNANNVMTYTVQSDIWSLGLSILEISKGSYPYPPETYGNIFSQLTAIVDGEPPQLPADRFSPEARSFVDQCLNKVPRLRPTYAKLLAHPWLKKFKPEDVDAGRIVRERLEHKMNHLSSGNTPVQTVPALHRGRTEGDS
ncbi:MAP kinase kinase Pbs2p [Trichomonascus vanleenenianus]|uniref:mitogen-activated protein kinase kinase PBS2 n=1 Tax=Trichomonascus vanleenenianus TaxID=2268995 RepID=UPI003EC9FE5C